MALRTCLPALALLLFADMAAAAPRDIDLEWHPPALGVYDMNRKCEDVTQMRSGGGVMMVFGGLALAAAAGVAIGTARPDGPPHPSLAVVLPAGSALMIGGAGLLDAAAKKHYRWDCDAWGY